MLTRLRNKGLRATVVALFASLVIAGGFSAALAGPAQARPTTANPAPVATPSVTFDDGITGGDYKPKVNVEWMVECLEDKECTGNVVIEVCNQNEKWPLYDVHVVLGDKQQTIKKIAANDCASAKFAKVPTGKHRLWVYIKDPSKGGDAKITLWRDKVLVDCEQPDPTPTAIPPTPTQSPSPSPSVTSPAPSQSTSASPSPSPSRVSNELPVTGSGGGTNISAVAAIIGLFALFGGGGLLLVARRRKVRTVLG